jgi:hypothetical protein
MCDDSQPVDITRAGLIDVCETIATQCPAGERG